MTLSRRLTLVLGCTQLTAWAVTYYVPAIAGAAVAESFGVGAGAVLGGFSAALLVTGLLSPLVGRVIERRGGRGMLAGASLVQSAGLLILAGSGGLPAWYAGWAVLGAGMAGGLYDAAFATTGRLLGAAARPALTGITLIGGFASTLGWPLGAWLIPSIGWRWTLAAYAAVPVLVNLPLVLLFLPSGVPPAVPSPAVPAAAARGRRLDTWLLVGFFTLRAVVATVVAIGTPVLFAGLGLGLVESLAIAAMIGPAQVGARLLQATAGRRLNPLATAWLAAALMPLAGLVLSGPGAWPGQGLPAAALVFVAGYGISNGLLTIVRGTLPLHLLGPAGYAARIGLLARPVMLAQAATPLLAAPLISGWPASRVFLGLAALGAAAALCLLPLHRRR